MTSIVVSIGLTVIIILGTPCKQRSKHLEYIGQQAARRLLLSVFTIEGRQTANRSIFVQ